MLAAQTSGQPVAPVAAVFDASLLTFEPLRKGGSFFALSTDMPQGAPF
jgi:hypothetical protein